MRVFVYGTLMSGFRNNERYLSKRGAKKVGDGTTGGRMVSLGMYPAAKFGDGGTIKGEVYDVTKDHVESMDGLEGCHFGKPQISLYYRRPVLVTMDDGKQVEAHTYEYQQSWGDRPLIKGGDWKAFCEENKEAKW